MTARGHGDVLVTVVIRWLLVDSKLAMTTPVGNNTELVAMSSCPVKRQGLAMTARTTCDKGHFGRQRCARSRPLHMGYYFLSGVHLL